MSNEYYKSLLIDIKASSFGQWSKNRRIGELSDHLRKCFMDGPSESIIWDLIECCRHLNLIDINKSFFLQLALILQSEENPNG